MAQPVLEFWFEFASTYSHLAANRVEDAARAAGVSLTYRPFLLGPIFKVQGWNDSPFNVYPTKGVYMWRDMERLAQKYGVPLRKPSVFPQNGLLPARVATAGASAPWLPAFVRGVYLANFRDDQDISSADVVKDVLATAGCADPEQALILANSPETKQALKDASAEAARRGVFGAPTFFAGDEMFWGNDRLEDALAWCRRAAETPATQSTRAG
jgi:2-hydroxychromene-2-carboxylate isomerase